MKKSLQSFIALFLALTLALPILPIWANPLEVAHFEPEVVDELILEDCISLGYAVDLLEVESFAVTTFSEYEATPTSTLVGAIVRTWGSQFAISSATEWNAARNMGNTSAHIIVGDIVVDNSIGFYVDPTVPVNYQRNERGALVLADGVLTATYETAPFAVNNFTHMINSFGADTPDGTWIEVWARAGRSSDDLESIAWLPVGAPTNATPALRANAHSAANIDDGFLTSGRWSPFSQDFNQGIRRTTSTAFVSGGAQQAVGSLVVSGAPANVVQYRVTLHRDSADIESPAVRHVHGSTRNAQIDQTSQPKEFPVHEFPARTFNGQTFPGGNTDRFPTVQSIFDYLGARPIDMDRQGWDRGAGDSSVVLSPGAGHGIYMQGFPMRSQQATGPILGGVNCSAVTIGMIVNGFLDMDGHTPPFRPMEEIGLNLFDYQLNGFGNWQFTVAGAGTYGLRAHVEYNDRHAESTDIMMETILRHLMSGHAIGLSLQFSGDSTAPHFIPRTDGTTAGHLIVLLGIVQRSGNWYVISYEPWSGSGSNANDRVYRELPMQNLVNAMRFSGANGTHNIIYVVRPGVEPGAGNAAPTRLESYLIQVAPGEFALSTDGTSYGIIPIGGMDRGQIGGPSGFVAYTVDPAFNFMGTTLTNPHGQSGTKFRYMPLGDTIRFGYDAHISPVQPFTYAQLTDPNFRMYVMMGNGFTHVIDASRVPTQAELYPELHSPGGEFRVNNPLRTVAPMSTSLLVGETTIGTLRQGLYATMGGMFRIFPAGTTIESVADFLAATPKPDGELLAHGDFIVVVNASQTLFVRFELDYFGLAFAYSGVGETVRIDLYSVTREGSPNFYAWSNPLTGWDGAGRIVYTADRVSTVGGPSLDTFSPNLVDTGTHLTGIRSNAATGYGSIAVRFVESNADYPGGFRFLPYSTTSEIMPWRLGLTRITARIEADDTSDPFHGEYRSFYIQALGGGPGANGGTMRVGYYTTGHLTPSFTWGDFRAPVVGERAYNLTFHDTIVMDAPVINVSGRPASPVAFPYTPYENDRPYWTWNTTWDGSAYANATTHTRVNWFWYDADGYRVPVPVDENHGHTFQAGVVYSADLFLCTGMHAAAGTWMNLPAAGAPFNTFVSNIVGLPTASDDGMLSVIVSRASNWNLLVTLTFDPGEIAVVPEFGLHAFNNGNDNNASLAQAGTIRIWTQLDGVNALVPYADLEVTARFADDTCAMEFIQVNRPWNNQGYVNLIDANKHAPWDIIYLTATLGEQVVELTLINNRFLGLRAFNNGTDTEVPSLAGSIRIWSLLGPEGNSAPIPMSAEITATDQDGNDATQFIVRNRQWTDAGWRNYYINFDVSKDAPWQTIYFTITVYGQTVSVLLINDWFESEPVAEFGVEIFNNGLGGTPSRPNAGLAQAGTIRIWTQLDGVNATVPFADLGVTATFANGDCAMEFVRVNNMWANPGNVNLIDVNKGDGAWHTITLIAALNAQAVELLLVNSRYVPAGLDVADTELEELSEYLLD